MYVQKVQSTNNNNNIIIIDYLGVYTNVYTFLEGTNNNNYLLSNP